MTTTDFENKWLRPCEGTISLNDAYDMYYQIRADAKEVGEDPAFSLLHNYDNKAFFKSIYWRVMCGAKRLVAQEQPCARCNSPKATRVVMREWDKKGCEFYYLNHLDCICDDCFNSTTGKEENKVVMKEAMLQELIEVIETIRSCKYNNRECQKRLMTVAMDNNCDTTLKRHIGAVLNELFAVDDYAPEDRAARAQEEQFLFIECNSLRNKITSDYHI